MNGWVFYRALAANACSQKNCAHLTALVVWLVVAAFTVPTVFSLPLTQDRQFIETRLPGDDDSESDPLGDQEGGQVQHCAQRLSRPIPCPRTAAAPKSVRMPLTAAVRAHSSRPVGRHSAEHANRNGSGCILRC